MTSTGVVNRDDVAYFGQLDGITFMAIATISDRPPPAFYTLCNVNGRPTLSRGYLGGRFTNTGAYQLTPMYLQWDAANSSLAILNNSGVQDGYIGLTTGGSSTPYLTIQSTPTPIILTTNDPAGYGSGLLSGCRYSLSTSTVSSNGIASNVDNGVAITTGSYAGLYAVNESTSSTTMDKVSLSFLPVDPVFLTPDSVPAVPSQVETTIALSQCIYMQGIEGYGTSSLCTNWQNGIGFNTEADVQPIPYFYSEDGTCGDDYTFTNFLSASTNVASSIGGCTEKSCTYSTRTNIFSCTTPSDNNGDDGGILSQWWFWVLIGIVVLIVIVIVIVVIIAAAKKKPVIEEVEGRELSTMGVSDVPQQVTA